MRRWPDDVRAVVVARALRAFADGMVSVLLVTHLDDLGFGPTELGAIVAGTLLGSAAGTAAVGAVSHRIPVRTLLLAACAVLAATGVGLALATSFGVLLVVAVVGTLNPSAGDVTAFLPLEQAHIAGRTEGSSRVGAYGVYNLAAAVAGGLGALASAVPDSTGTRRAAFLLYVVVGAACAVLYRRAIPRTEVTRGDRRHALGPSSRRTVFGLAALFSLDSAAGGLVVQSLLVAWLHQRFDLSPGATGAVFLGVGLLGAASQLLAAPLARRIGLVRTMVFTHLPANGLLVAAAVVPTAPLAVAFLLLRALFSQVDVPARQALVMAVVAPEERPAAASATNVPRSLAAATTPLLAGWLLERSGDVGWPLLLAGVGKATYNVLLWRRASRFEPR